MRKKHVVIVGGTRGSGRVLVRRFSEGGQLISLLGRHPSLEVKRQLEGVCFYQVDLGDAAGVNKVIDQLIRENGKISCLIFYQRYREGGDDWVGEWQISLTATKMIIDQCIDNFDGLSDNAIVVVSTTASRFIHDEQPVSYHVAKAGLNQMVRYYAVTLGPKGIRVNCVSPSIVIKEESREFYTKQKELRHLYEKITPLRRMGNADDIADVIEFLCSDKSLFITGQEIVVDGGLSLVGQSSLARKLTNLKNLKVTR